jgi:HAE1 family hydrophobic/amphiphilic exporter-1
MSSTSSSSGNYTLTVTFAVGTNLNAALTLVQNMVNGATAQLPETVQSQGVTVRKVSTNILQVISIYSDDERYDATYLSNYAIINLQYPLGRLAGVGQIQVFGAGPYSMRVWLDPNKLKYYNLTTLDVVHAIQQQNVQVVAGRLGAPPVPPDQTFQFTVNALGRLADTKQFSDIIVKSVRSQQGETAQLVRVKDIARVDLDQQFYSNFGGLSGKQSGQILVYALPGANAIDVGKKVDEAWSR